MRQRRFTVDHESVFDWFVRGSVQLRQRVAHGGGGERGGVHGVHGVEPDGLRQQRRDHGAPQDARDALLRVQHHGPLRRRNEARRDCRRLQIPRHHADDPDDAEDVPNTYHHALHDADADDPDHHHAVHDSDDPDVLWRRWWWWRHHHHAEHDAVHVVPKRGRPRFGVAGRVWPGLVCDVPASSAALDARTAMINQDGGSALIDIARSCLR